VPWDKLQISPCNQPTQSVIAYKVGLRGESKQGQQGSVLQLLGSSGT